MLYCNKLLFCFDINIFMMKPIKIRALMFRKSTNYESFLQTMMLYNV